VTDDDLSSGPAPIPGTPEANDLVVRGGDGDPLPDRTRLTSMVEIESYERVIEGLKMSADACMHLAKQEPKDGETWKSIGQMLDKLRLEAVKLAGIKITNASTVTDGARGNPYTWRKARDRFLNGLQQASGGMRQLATCFRADFQWALMAQELDRREQRFRKLLYSHDAKFDAALVKPFRPLILPAGFVRH
jgi:hypothetical protein